MLPLLSLRVKPYRYRYLYDIVLTLGLPCAQPWANAGVGDGFSKCRRIGYGEGRGERRMKTSLTPAQRIVQLCLLLVAAIAIAGGALQMVLGQPDTSPRLDNIHRFMAGVYLSTGLISLWAALTVRRQGILVLLIALGVLLAGIGRLVSIAQVGLPEPAALWLGYLVPELLLPFVIAAAHLKGRGGQHRATEIGSASPGSVSPEAVI